MLGMTLGLSACMVGPDYHAPKAPKTSRYTSIPTPRLTVATANAGNPGTSQYLRYGQSIPADWWHLFHSPQLNQMIQLGLANSQSLAAAEATLRKAQQILKAQIGYLYFPGVDLGLSAERQRTTGLSAGLNTPAEIFSLYNTSVNATYQLDLFGKNRRLVEAARAQVDYARYELMASYLTLTTNIVTTAVTVSSLADQIDATKELIREYAAQYTIVKKQNALGGASDEEVLLQQTQLQQTKALLPPLQKELAMSRHTLAVLTGQLTSQSHLPIIALGTLHLPKNLPVSLPSALVQQRPDIQASAALLHVASAEIGVATANLLPQIMLGAGYGWLASEPSELFQLGSNIWNFGASLTQPLFHGFALWSERNAKKQAFEVALANYKQTVLDAFKNVADALRAIQADALEFKAQKMAEQSAYKTFVVTKGRFDLGGQNYLQLLEAQQQYQRAKLKRIQAQAARYTDTAALFDALGGGWWHWVVPSEKKKPCHCKRKKS